jgi:glycosyltransferase involved in cell wall biosynthesis
MILLVRGDLRSETGWGRATRALLAAIADRFTSVLGIDLHYHPDRALARFPYPLVDPNTVATYTPLMTDLVALHACHPDRIEWMPGAINVGWWFWETDKIQLDFDWKERLEVLDVLFVPSGWHAAWIAEQGVKTRAVVLQWPFDLQAPKPNAHADHVDVYRLFNQRTLSTLPPQSAAGTSASQQRQDVLLTHSEKRSIGPGAEKSYAITVQSDSPRKGLACLLSEWRDYRRMNGALETLLIRFSGLDVSHDACSLLATLSRTALAADRGDETAFADVRAIVDHIPEPALFNAYAGAAVMITPTFGEGFGGTIVEAAQAGTPIIAPRHTACGQLLPDAYPLSYESLPYIGALIAQASIVPSNSTWHLPQPGTIASALVRLDSMSMDERGQASSMLFEHLKSLLAPERIAGIFFHEIAQVQQRRKAA